MYTPELLRTIKKEHLREWARVNGYDMQAFDQLEVTWERANAEEVVPAPAPVVQKVTPTVTKS